MALLARLFHTPVPWDQGRRYDRRLPRVLREEHRVLLEMLRRVRNAHDIGDAPGCRAALKRFQRKLMEHLVVEKVRLYPHILSVMERENPAAAAVARRFEDEADEVAQQARALVQRFGDDDAAVLRAAFVQQLEAMKTALRDRVRYEEHALFPMYFSEDEHPDEVDSTLWHNLGFR